MGSPTQLGTSGFWGLVIEPGKRYSKQVDVPFHITAAVLDPLVSTNDEDDIVSVMLEVDGMEVIICNLSRKGWVLQFPLNLRFEEGSRIAFYTIGMASNVHLSGNVIGSEDGYSAFETRATGTAQKKRKGDSVDASSKKIKSDNVLASLTSKMKGIESKLNSMEGVDSDESYSDEMESDDYEMDEEVDSEEELEEEEEGDEEEDEEEESSDEEEEEICSKGKEVKVTNASPKSMNTPKNNKAAQLTLTPKDKIAKSTNEKPAQTQMITPKKEKTQEMEAVNGSMQKPKKKEGNNAGASPHTPGKSPKVVKMGGITCEDLIVGTGNEAKYGKNVSMYYEGRLVSNNKMFDKCMSGKPFRFRLGSKDIIQGWNIAVAGMKVGGKRKFVCPPHLAYGKRGAPPDIPPQAALVFVVELKAVG